MPRREPPSWVGDRQFTVEDLALTQWTARRFTALSRWELALTLCENLPWRAPNGQLKAHACLPLLDQLAATGLVTLPAKQVKQAKPSHPRLHAAQHATPHGDPDA